MELILDPSLSVLPRSDILKEDRNIPKIKKVNLRIVFNDGFQEK